MSKASVERLAYIGSKPGAADPDRDSDSWYTPKIYVDSAKTVMEGGDLIELDPFSSMFANEQRMDGHGSPWRIARRIFTEDDSALEKSTWRHKHGRPVRSVWMNPPYSAGLIRQAVDKFLDEWNQGSILQAIVLVNNATDTRWFEALASKAAAFCWTNHRIAFETYDGKSVSGNTRGQTFVFFGSHAQALAFCEVFSKHGLCLSR